MTTKSATKAGDRAVPSVAMLLCECGKWAFRVNSHFPLFDRGPAAKRPAVGCPIDWHVVPTADPPSVRAPKAENSVNEASAMDPDLVRTIRAEDLLTHVQGFELPRSVTANELAFLEGIVVF
jgi:hypothetical protein